MIPDLWDRISFAAEGVWLRAGDGFDALRSRPWGIPAAAGAAVLLVAGAAALILGGEDEGAGPGRAASLAQSEPPSVINDPQLVEERGFSIALPDSWHRIEPPEGASFAAGSGDGLGEATLWVERNPDLGFDEFVDQSLAGLDGLGEDARVTDRVEGPTPETSIAVLEAEVPVDGGVAGPYRVTLRAAGPYRYYLATSIGAGAPPRLIAEAELLSASFRPQVKVK
ncbi:MAG: hypothetical protein BroJett022_14660 [Actinomycetes bacterium]|nr:MAG: hypothetical protein BroJett022_14660 [Actinomycetes bacterium]